MRHHTLDMEVGSHLSVRRTGYSHHGIYIGRGMVIHFTGDKGAAAFIKKETLQDFLYGGTLKIIRHRNPKYTPQEVVARAYSKLGQKQGEYNLLFDNCEHFANWCIEGKHISHQANTGLGIALGSAAGIAIMILTGGRIRM